MCITIVELEWELHCDMVQMRKLKENKYVTYPVRYVMRYRGMTGTLTPSVNCPTSGGKLQMTAYCDNWSTDIILSLLLPYLCRLLPLNCSRLCIHKELFKCSAVELCLSLTYLHIFHSSFILTCNT